MNSFLKSFNNCLPVLIALLFISLELFSSAQVAPQSAGSDPNAQAPEGADNRPHLKHQTDKMESYGLPSADDSARDPLEWIPSGVLVAPGLHLPTQGRVWALDRFDGKPELVHLKYSSIDINNHTGSNLLKSEAAPFLYKPKKTIELKGAASAVRLHQATPTLFLHGLMDDHSDTESSDGSGKSVFALVRLEAKANQRVAATIAFTQITGKAERSENVIDVATERIPGTDWYKMEPKEPLSPGEYGLMQLPQDKKLFGSIVYDFAIDPTAPEGNDPIKAD